MAFGKREFLFVSVEDKPLKDGTWVSGTVSVEINGSDNGDESDTNNRKRSSSSSSLPSLRRNKSYTRAFQDSIAFYKPVPGRGVASSSSQSHIATTPNEATGSGDDSALLSRTKLTIVCRIDLNDSSEEGTGGCIPMWLYVKTIGVTGARSVLNMRRALLEEEEHDQAAGKGTG